MACYSETAPLHPPVDRGGMLRESSPSPTAEEDEEEKSSNGSEEGEKVYEEEEESHKGCPGPPVPSLQGADCSPPPLDPVTAQYNDVINVHFSTSIPYIQPRPIHRRKTKN